MTKLNILTWTFGLVSFLKSRYLRATLFGLTWWPPLWLKISAIITIGSQYSPLECTTLTLLHLITTIEFISGQFVVLFPWLAIIALVNTIWGMPTTLIVAIDNVEFWLRFLPFKTPLDSLPNFVVDVISIPLITTSMLGTTIFCIHVVVILALID